MQIKRIIINMTSATPAIELTKLSKRYPGSRDFALHNLSLHITAGEVYGFLGSNGAGKSTTIRTLLGFITPTSGSATILGKDIVRDSVAVKKSVGYLAGDVSLYNKATGKELLDYLSSLQPPKNKAYRAELEKRFEVQTHRVVGELSKGNRQKIGILQALMHEPDVLIFDEPTSGLDPLMQEVFYRTIREHTSKGAAVFASSHNLAEAERMCDRIGVIKNGKLIHEQTIGDDSLAAPKYIVTFASQSSCRKAATIPAIVVVSQSKNTLTFTPKADISEALAAISSYKITDFETQNPSLEDEFLSFYHSGTEKKP